METNQNKNNDDIMQGCAGCGCLILLVWGIFSAVSWGWHIHWLFGVLILIALLGIL